MPNRNYIAGRAFEYETMRAYEKLGYNCIRASGSHGEFDVVAYKHHDKPNFIQCKKTESKATADLLTDRFIEDTIPSYHYHQTMRVKIRGVKRPMEVSV